MPPANRNAEQPALNANERRKASALVPVLLKWFVANARDLPWRRTFDPYAIWISEIMLQQTQVKTVIPYWERWMRELPDAPALAAAPQDKVLKLWEGLGYYTRARNLQKAARLVLEEHGGTFPRDFAAVLALPGIGRYTAGAICSIACDMPTPILDGNVIRVLTRLFGITENPREKKANARLWQLAEALVLRAKESPPSGVTRSASFLNQSLMELGALICTPRQPRCGECPVRGQCTALREDRVESLPNLGPRATVTARRFLAVAAERDGQWLVRQRSGGVVNAHLWEFPNMELPVDGDGVVAAAKKLIGAHRDLRPLAQVRHSITRYRILLEAYRARVKSGGDSLSDTGRWLALEDLEHLAFTSAHRRVLEALRRSELS
jgi:A/G-specific adenine glycosylase